MAWFRRVLVLTLAMLFVTSLTSVASVAAAALARSRAP